MNRGSNTMPIPAYIDQACTDLAEGGEHTGIVSLRGVAAEPALQPKGGFTQKERGHPQRLASSKEAAQPKGDLTHVVKAHSADETAGANHGKTGVDLGNPGNPRFEAGNS